jgi:hypothetical protein
VVRLDHAPLNVLDFRLAEHAETYPFCYAVDDLPI